MRKTSALQTPARRPDWLFRLEASIAAARGRVFAWGAHDCCLFPCDAVLAMTGVDLARGFRGRYRTLRGALRFLRTAGGVPGLAESIARARGIPEIPVGLARRGDVVVVRAGGAFEPGPGGHDCLAIVDLTGAAALVVGLAGVVEVPATLWQRAWRIG